MGKPERTTQTTQQTTYPNYIEDAQKGLAADLAKWFADQKASGGSTVAGLSPLQQQATTAAQGLLGKPTKNYATDILTAGSQGYTPSMVNGQQITAQMNPYLDSVGADTLDAMRDEKLNSDATRAAMFAASPTASGSDRVLAEASSDANYEKAVGSQINNLLAQGYSQAQAVAMANADSANQAGQFNAGQKLSGTIAAGGAETDAFNRGLSGIATGLQVGSITQAQAQAELDRLWTLYQRYQSTLPGIAGTQTATAPDTSPTLLQQLLGAGLTIGGMAVGGPAGAAGGSLLGNMLGGN